LPTIHSSFANEPIRPRDRERFKAPVPKPTLSGGGCPDIYVLGKAFLLFLSPKRVAIVGGWLVVVFQLLFVPPAALLARLSLCTCCRGAKVFGAGQSAAVTSATMLQESREK